jgi:hypothetical protein
MATQAEKAKSFRKLHVPGEPLVLFNIWDPGSAKVVAETAAMALATSSWAVSVASGYSDGEHTSLPLAIDYLRRITDSHLCERMAIPHSGHTDSLNGKSELGLRVQLLRWAPTRRTTRLRMRELRLLLPNYFS